METGKERDGLVRPLLSQTITGVGAETESGATLGVTESDFVVCGGERVRLGAETVTKNQKNLEKKCMFEVFLRWERERKELRRRRRTTKEWW